MAYLRNPLGKFAEDVGDYFTQPIKTMHSMMSPYMHAIEGAFENRNGFGGRVYDPYVSTPGKLLRAIGDLAAYSMEGAGPSMAVRSAGRLITGTSQRPWFDAAQIVGGGFGLLVSRGTPGGPIKGELRAAKDEHDFEVQRAMPAIREMTQLGRTQEAVKELRRLKVPPNLMRYYLMQATNPRASADQVLKTLEFATPEQRDRILRQLKSTPPPAPPKPSPAPRP